VLLYKHKCLKKLAGISVCLDEMLIHRLFAYRIRGIAQIGHAANITSTIKQRVTAEKRILQPKRSRFREEP
jgi:hypothetical protein